MGADMTPDDKARRAATWEEHLARGRAFAAARGWTLARRRFTLAELAGGRRVNTYDRYLWRAGIDHDLHFRIGRRPVAILAQPYPGDPDMARLRESVARGDVPLRLETPPEPSWWYRGWTEMVLIRRADPDAPPLPTAAIRALAALIVWGMR